MANSSISLTRARSHFRYLKARFSLLHEIHLAAFFLHWHTIGDSYCKGPSLYGMGEDELTRSQLQQDDESELQEGVPIYAGDPPTIPRLRVRNGEWGRRCEIDSRPPISFECCADMTIFQRHFVHVAQNMAESGGWVTRRMKPL